MDRDIFNMALRLSNKAAQQPAGVLPVPVARYLVVASVYFLSRLSWNIVRLPVSEQNDAGAEGVCFDEFHIYFILQRTKHRLAAPQEHG
jgi:hypothetical protein